MRRVAIALAFALTVVASLDAQTGAPPSSSSALPSYRHRVLGVFDATSGAELPGVTVLDLVTGTSAVTTATGTVSLGYLPDGGSLVRLQKIGYEAVSMIVPISPNDTTPLTIVMRRITELPKVVTSAQSSKYRSAGLRGFEERRRLGFAGYFIGDSVLRAEENRRLGDVLRSHAPSVMIKDGSGSSALLFQSPRCVVGGPPQVYLDGVPLSPDPIAGGSRPSRNSDGTLANVPFNLSDFQVSDFAGVEWYPDNDALPEQFEHTSLRCGALVLWSRER